MSQANLLERHYRDRAQADLQEKRYDLTNGFDIQLFFNGAVSSNEESVRYEMIKEANGGLRPAALDTHPIRTKFFSADYPGSGIGYVCGE